MRRLAVITSLVFVLVVAMPVLAHGTHDNAATPAATPEVASMGPGTALLYLTITNNGDEADRLIGGMTAAAGAIELHQDVETNGISGMRPVVGGIEIPAHATIDLEAAGFHVMLVNLTADLTDGSHYTISLDFATAGEVTLDVPVRWDNADDIANPNPISVGSLTISRQWTRPAPALLGTPESMGGMPGMDSMGTATALP